MNRTKLTFVIVLAAAAALSGCSGFKLGAFCYAPASGGECMATSATVVELPEKIK